MKNKTISKIFSACGGLTIVIPICIMYMVRPRTNSLLYGTMLAAIMISVLVGVCLLIVGIVYFFKSLADIHHTHVQNIKNKSIQNKVETLQSQNFVTSKTIKSDPFVLIDGRHHCFAILKEGSSDMTFYRYSDVISYEKIERVQKFGEYRRFSHSAVYYDKCVALAIKVNMRDVQTPCIYLNFIDSASLEGSETYNNAMISFQEALSILEYIKATD